MIQILGERRLHFEGGSFEIKIDVFLHERYL